MQFPVRLPALAALALIAACAPLTQPDMRMGASPAVVVAPASPFTAAERRFVTLVASRTVYDIEVSRLAADRAVSPAVRDLARRIAQDDTLMNDELVVLMASHGVAPPKELPPAKVTKLHRLASLPRSDAFDNGYLRVVGIEDRRKSIAMFERARRDVRDRDLRAWIDRSLTVMRVHLANAQSVAASLAG